MPAKAREPLYDVESSQLFSYVLILRCDEVSIMLNRSKALISKGYYVYVGSANIKRPYLRVIRHLAKGGKKLKWHVDYLTEVCDPISALLCSGVHENTLYEILANTDHVTPSIKGFGCSDYRRTHETHLFKLDVNARSPHDVISYLTSILRIRCGRVEVVLR